MSNNPVRVSNSLYRHSVLVDDIRALCAYKKPVWLRNSLPHPYGPSDTSITSDTQWRTTESATIFGMLGGSSPP